MSKDKQEVTGGTQTVDESHSEATPKRVQFDYLKSSCFRVIHADGVIGGLTPRLDIHMDFWSERFPIH